MGTTALGQSEMETRVEDVPTITKAIDTDWNDNSDNWPLPVMCEPTITKANEILDKDWIDDDEKLPEPELAHSNNGSYILPKWTFPYFYVSGVCLLTYAAVRLRNRK